MNEQDLGGPAEIHPTAVVDRGAELGQGVRVDTQSLSA